MKNRTRLRWEGRFHPSALGTHVKEIFLKNLRVGLPERDICPALVTTLALAAVQGSGKLETAPFGE